MAKSKKRFANPRRWAPMGAGVMQETENGGSVRHEDYVALLGAYRMALHQLDRAAKHVAGYKRAASAQ